MPVGELLIGVTHAEHERFLEVRGGKHNESAFGQRMVGAGPRWEAIEALFAIQCRKLGINKPDTETSELNTFRRPSRQQELF